ncbi:hypothetical protein [Burkholderia sp. LMG 32019]|uniref:hypothetical protein n=1 Tax=Burkholderia sp. LMG 32019 TaxID=3158173 RepID=UPI003C2FD4C2
MNRAVSLLAFAFTGIASGYAAAGLMLAFAPMCGYDCENRSAGIFISTVGTCLLGFVLVGHLATRRAHVTVKRFSLTALCLSAAVLLAAGCCYVAELHRHYREAEAARPVQTDFDFMYMAIVTREVPTYSKASRGSVAVSGTIPRWQRCAIDGAWCDTQPRQAHMRCKTGEVYVNEADWPAFSLIPEENIRGAVPMKSMKLCAPGNIPDD